MSVIADAIPKFEYRAGWRFFSAYEGSALRIVIQRPSAIAPEVTLTTVHRTSAGDPHSLADEIEAIVRKLRDGNP